MKSCCALALAFLLTGCTGTDWTALTSYPSPAASPESPVSGSPAAFVVDSVTTRAEGRCRDAARDRAADGDAQGFDTDIQQSVYDKTYVSCMEWAKRLGS